LSNSFQGQLFRAGRVDIIRLAGRGAQSGGDEPHSFNVRLRRDPNVRATSDFLIELASKPGGRG
jgi:hypothetical protein